MFTYILYEEVMLRVTPDNVEAVAEAFRSEPGLTVSGVEISECTSEQLPVLLELVLDCVSAEALVSTTSFAMEACIIGSETISGLRRLWHRCPALRSVRIYLCDWKYSSALRRALLNRFSPPNEAAAKEAALGLLHYNSAGDRSEFARNHWSVFKTANLLFHALYESCPTLKEITISKSSAGAVWRPFCDVAESVPNSLVSTVLALAGARGIDSVDLSANYISDLFLVEFPPVFSSHSSVRSVSLADNRITDRGLANLLNSLRDSMTEELTLDLRGNYIQLGHEELRIQLEEILARFPGLSINVSGNPIEIPFDHARVIFDHSTELASPGAATEGAMETDDEDDSDFTGSDSAVASSRDDSEDDSDVSLVSEGSDAWKLLDE
jgi:hypothetical protein